MQSQLYKSSKEIIFEELTESEKLLNSENKWENFLINYKNFFNKDFDWVDYIKYCRIYKDGFDIKEFIKKYGLAASSHFRNYREKLFLEKGFDKKNEKEKIKIRLPGKEIINLLHDLSEVRCRLLIKLLTPKTRKEKRILKNIFKNGKKKRLSEAEILKSFVGINFIKGEEDPQDNKYTRQEMMKLIDKAEQLIKDDESYQTVRLNNLAKYHINENAEIKKEKIYDGINAIKLSEQTDELNHKNTEQGSNNKFDFEQDVNESEIDKITKENEEKENLINELNQIKL